MILIKVIKKYVAILFVLVMGMHVHTTAQAPRIFPYEGSIETEREGVIENGRVTLKFSLYDDERVMHWEETHENVEIFEGKFRVVLGESNPFAEQLFVDFSPLFLGIDVRITSEEGVQIWEEVTPPDERHRLLASPYALTISEAKNFRVHGEMNVKGNLTVSSGAKLLNTVTANGPAQIHTHVRVQEKQQNQDQIAPQIEVAQGGRNLNITSHQINSDGVLQLQPTIAGEVPNDTVLGGDVEVSQNLHLRGHLEGMVHSEEWVIRLDREAREPNQLELIGDRGRREWIMCTLSGMGMRGSSDPDDPYADCKVFKRGDRWILEADEFIAKAECRARCFGW